MAVIEETCSNWFVKLSAALSSELERVPLNRGPLAEIEFWKERHANLSAVNEQIRRPTVQDIIKVCQTMTDMTAHFFELN